LTNVRVAILEDNHLLRGLLVSDLEHSGFEIVGNAARGADALLRFPLAKPDVLILDLNLPDIPGVEIGIELCRLLPELRVIILSDFIKPLLLEALPKALRPRWEYHIKQEVISPEILRTIILQPGKELSANRFTTSNVQHLSMHGLSPRKSRILDLLVLGKTNQQIASDLNLSIKTVEFHLTTLFKIYSSEADFSNRRVLLASKWVESQNLTL
jgi:NarL family two-component system response regulator LiaR